MTPPMLASDVGRNDPCPCGSGKKYKKCCLVADEQRHQSPVQKWHDLDYGLVQDLGQYARRRFGEAWAHIADEYPGELDPDADAAVQFPMFLTWALYEHKFEGRPVVDWFLDDRGRNLSGDEKDWLEAQRRAWLSIWEVTDVVPGSTVDLRDVLTGQTRHVTEITGSKSLIKHLLVLGRIVDHAGVSLFRGLHPNSLQPVAGSELVADLRDDLDLPKELDPARLREDDLATILISCWQDEIDEQAAQPLPMLTNTDGEELAWTTDVFGFTNPSAKAEIAQRLAEQPDVEAPDPGEKDQDYTFVKRTKIDKGERPGTIVGSVRLLARELRAEANSRARADALRARIESLCAGLVRHRRRTEKDMQAMLSEAQSKPQRRSKHELVGPEADAILLEFKKKHYANWVDESLPALDGLSAREAAQNPKYRARLNALLKEMEQHESELPKGQRFSFDAIRVELGLAAS